MKIKGFQGHKRVEWVKVEHPFTAISAATEVHANHNETQNSALSRRANAYRQRQICMLNARKAYNVFWKCNHSCIILRFASPKVSALEV
jgi:hypothetical protein